jgi:hypothetical protein
MTLFIIKCSMIVLQIPHSGTYEDRGPGKHLFALGHLAEGRVLVVEALGGVRR